MHICHIIHTLESDFTGLQFCPVCEAGLIKLSTGNMTVTFLNFKTACGGPKPNDIGSHSVLKSRELKSRFPCPVYLLLCFLPFIIFAFTVLLP